MAHRLQSEEVFVEMRELIEALAEIRDGATTLASSELDAGEAQSIVDARTGAETALANIHVLRVAIEKGDIDSARSGADTLRHHVQSDVARPAIINDLNEVIAEAQAEIKGRRGVHRQRFKSFIDTGQKLVSALGVIAGQAEAFHQMIAARTTRSYKEEFLMANQDDATGIAAELQAIGRQISFLASAQGVASSPGTEGAGRYRTVSDQLMASLDALGLPHHGVQFSSAGTEDAARDDLIEGLLDSYRQIDRNGIPVFVPGSTEGRARSGLPTQSRILSGAAKVAAHLVRAEADNILAILDRLPDMTRFRVRAGVPSAAEARGIVADRFEDLDEVMADPIGVNLPRAIFVLGRIAKSLYDFFDYANLERELMEVFQQRGVSQALLDRLPQPVPDDDEVGERRTVVRSEELRREISELADSLIRLAERVQAPLSDIIGTTAARLEQSLTVASGSAHALRDILVRSGSSLPEQDVQFLIAGLKTEVQIQTGMFRHDRGRKVEAQGQTAQERRRIILSLDQLLDWIIEVSEPYVGATYYSGTLEEEDFLILAAELDSQAVALDQALAEGNRLGFAYRLPGPMRQIEELKYHVGVAARLARELTTAA